MSPSKLLFKELINTKQIFILDKPSFLDQQEDLFIDDNEVANFHITTLRLDYTEISVHNKISSYSSFLLTKNENLEGRVIEFDGCNYIISLDPFDECYDVILTPI